MAKTPRSKPWYYGRLDYHIEKSPNCCSIGDIGNIQINTWDHDDPWRDNSIYKLSQLAVSSEIKRMTKELSKSSASTYSRRTYGYICTFTERLEKYSLYVKAFQKAGWKLAMTPKSCHGGHYKVFMFCKSFK